MLERLKLVLFTLLNTVMTCFSLQDASVLYFLIRHPGRTLIFTNSIDASSRLHSILKKVIVDFLLTYNYLFIVASFVFHW